MNKYKLIAMIPARMGSKRILKKNIRYLFDKPLIQYPIDLALESNAFESVWVNTESEKLGEFSKSMGANFHKRPEELSTDEATNRDFVYEFLKNHNCDYVVMINPTSPLLRKETMDNFVKFLNNNDFDTILSVISIKAESFYKGNPVNFTVKEKINSQLLEPIEEVMWAMTAWKRECFIQMQENGVNPVFGGKIGRFVIPKDESADLDTEEDWNIAEGAIMARNARKDNIKKYLEI
ncbi:acylneuraminate cytidylyltransferase family protein [Clostridium sp. ZBS15]|uniref:acylneuraminate cytidylyltransferase family protein n=1 Tax=Clostridium sp. ZBS15 TaxID=2949969 RepID=UPI00207ABABD|nr:acylneuraminate cytidylyltransferase family protein [Clostridium sp. ZBS15]